MCSDCDYICGTEHGVKMHKKNCTGGNASSGGDKGNPKVKKKIPTKSKAAPDGDKKEPKAKKKVSPKSNAAPGEDKKEPKAKKKVSPKRNAAPGVDQNNQKVVIPPKNNAAPGEDQSIPKGTTEVPPENDTASGEDQNIPKETKKVPPENKEAGFCEIVASKPDDKDKKALYMCSDCHLIVGSLLVMKKHKKSCTLEKVPSNNGLPADLKTSMYVCPECDFYCPSEQGMKQHYRACSNAKVSIACQTDGNSSQSGAPVVVMVRPSSITDAEGAPLLEDNTDTGGDPPPGSKVSTECQTDPVTFKRDRNEKVYCTHCSYTTTKPFNLKIHLKTHTGEKPYLCPYCAKRFRDKSQLVTHERTHNGQRPYACDICDKCFSTSVVRNRHKIRWHTHERPFVCNICYISFKFQYDLKCHIRTHSSQVFP